MKYLKCIQNKTQNLSGLNASEGFRMFQHLQKSDFKGKPKVG